MDFAGFDDWVEIFRGGQVIDSAGVKHDGDALIKNAVSRFNAGEHEPPVVVGHPQTNSPAFGWVKGLKACPAPNGHPVLMAKFGEVNPDFAALVQSGAYKKRSAAFYPDGRLRHVGFLGAAPPAIKGLADLKFSEEAGAVFEFSGYSDNIVRRLFGKLRDWLVESQGTEKADAVISPYDLEDLAYEATREKVKDALEEQGKNINAAPAFTEGKGADMADEKKMVSFSEADVERIKAEALEEGKKAAAAEFAEAQKAIRAASEKKAWGEFVEDGIKAGKILPAWKEQGLLAFGESLIETNTAITFSEGKTETPLSWFKGFLSGLPQAVNFSEVATRGTDPGPGSTDAAGKLVALARARAAKDGIAFSEAVNLISQENPALCTEYIQG